MRNLLHGFLDWWKAAPLYKSIWFIPFVMTLFVIAVIKNILTGEKLKWQLQQPKDRSRS